MQSLMTVNYTQRTTPSLGCTDHYFQSTVTALCVCFNITTKTDPSKCMFKFMIYAILLDPYVFSRRHDCAIWVLIHPLALKTVLYESQTYGLALFRNYLFAANFTKCKHRTKLIGDFLCYHLCQKQQEIINSQTELLCQAKWYFYA